MSKKCCVCVKSVYPMDPQMNLDGQIIHKTCAKCEDCQCQITLSNFTLYVAPDSKVTLLCKTHYFKRFHEGGSYLGGEKFNVKNPRDFKEGEGPANAIAEAAPAAAAADVAAGEATAPGETPAAWNGVKLKSAGVDTSK